MRLLSAGTIALGLLGAAAIYLMFFRLSDANIAALVPEDMQYGVFYRSLDELRAAYEHPHARSDVDPARRRVGAPVNVPGLDGIAYGRPVGTYVDRGGEEVHLVPFRDFDAFENAFDENRENLHLRAPEKIAERYLGLSRTGRLPAKGPDHRLVRRGLQYPIALVGYPDDARTLRRMLLALLVPDVARETGGVPTLAQAAVRLPDPLADAVAAELADLVVGIAAPEGKNEPVTATIDAQPVTDGVFAGAAALQGTLGLRDVVSCLPVKTTMFFAAGLDAAGWKRAGLPVDIGAAAVAAAVIDDKPWAGRYQLLVVARPAAGAEMLDRLDTLAPLLFAPELAEGAQYETVMDGPTAVRVARLAARPEPLAGFLRSGTRNPRPVYFATARENGLWFGAIGAYAERAVRSALGCRRGATELSILRSELLAHHDRFVHGDAAAYALVSPEGLRAFELPMPYFGTASLAQPTAITAAVRAGKRLVANIRLAR